jgi:enoyl-CoA hydratase/carnithine racemase
MLDELLDELNELAEEPAVTCMVITGRGRHFSAGVDVRGPFFMEGVADDSVFAGKRLLDRQHHLIETLHHLPFLTVAAVNGAAIGGGGFGLAMACDMRVAVSTAAFRMVPTRLAVVQDFGLTWMLRRLIGPSRTLHLAVFGQELTAPTALEWGLVNEVVEDQNALRERVTALRSEIDGMDPETLRMLKLVVRNAATSPLREQLGLEAVANGLAFLGPEFTRRKRALLDGTGR